jgi:hypothetical protein
VRPQDREAGYDWSLSIWQMEVSLTQIYDRPLGGREFFEEIVFITSSTPFAIAISGNRSRICWGGRGAPHHITYDLRRLRLKDLIYRLHQNQPLLRHSLRLEGRSPVLTTGGRVFDPGRLVPFSNARARVRSAPLAV